MKKLVDVIVILVFVFALGIAQFSFSQGCKPEVPKKIEVVKEAPKPIPSPPPVIPKPVIKPKPTTIGSIKFIPGAAGSVIKVKLNKQSANLIRKGAKVRVFIAYMQYEGTSVDKDGTVTINAEWTPPNASGKIGVQIWQPTKTYRGGYSVSSAVVRC